jgi:exodeoxyribonuclease VII small subunit
MTKEKPVEELNYEQAYQELVVLVDQLESGDLELEESLKLFERGQVLAKHCADLLENAELRLRQLMEDESGELVEVDLHPMDEEE